MQVLLDGGDHATVSEIMEARTCLFAGSFRIMDVWATGSVASPINSGEPEKVYEVCRL